MKRSDVRRLTETLHVKRVIGVRGHAHRTLGRRWRRWWSSPCGEAIRVASYVQGIQAAVHRADRREVDAASDTGRVQSNRVRRRPNTASSASMGSPLIAAEDLPIPDNRFAHMLPSMRPPLIAAEDNWSRTWHARSY